MDNEFAVGKIKVGLLRANDAEVVVEYEIEGQRHKDTVQVSDLMAFLRGIYEELKGYKVEKSKLNPERHFDSDTVEKLKSVGIHDFSYIARGLD